MVDVKPLVVIKPLCYMIYNHIAPSYEDIADVTVTVYMADVTVIVADVIATVPEYLW